MYSVGMKAEVMFQIYCTKSKKNRKQHMFLLRTNLGVISRQLPQLQTVILKGIFGHLLSPENLKYSNEIRNLQMCFSEKKNKKLKVNSATPSTNYHMNEDV